MYITFIIGANKSGKSTLADKLVAESKHKAIKMSFRTPLDDIFYSIGMKEPSRKQYQAAADMIRRHSPDFFCQSLSDRIKKTIELTRIENFFIDDLRYMDDFFLPIMHSVNFNDVKTFIIFADYRSPDYDNSGNHSSDKLARMAAENFDLKHGDVLTQDQIVQLISDDFEKLNDGEK